MRAADSIKLSEIRNEIFVISSQKSEVRSQKSEVRSQKSEVRSQKSEFRNHLLLTKRNSKQSRTELPHRDTGFEDRQNILWSVRTAS